MPELGAGGAQVLALAAHSAFAFPTDVEPSDRRYTDDVLAPELRLRGGALETPAGPGCAFVMDEAQVARYAIAWCFGGRK